MLFCGVMSYPKHRIIKGTTVPGSEEGRIEWPKFTGNSRQRRFQRRQTVWTKFELDRADRFAQEFLTVMRRSEKRVDTLEE